MGETVVEKMYGTIHGISISPLFMPQLELYLKPSEEMLKQISEMPKGTRVGIEEIVPQERKELENRTINGVKIALSAHIGKYWKDIGTYLKKKNLEIVYLDDATLFRENGHHTVAIHTLKEQLEGNGKKNPEIKEQLQREIYSLETEAEYSHHILREESIMRKIKELQPSVVIIGKGHSDYLWARQSYANNGIRIKSYAVENILERTLNRIDEDVHIIMNEGRMTPKSASEYISRGLEANSLNECSELDDEFLANLIARETLEKRYLADKTGRITKSTPDFIGTWDLQLPSRGLFEMFITKREGNAIRGTIEDIFGAAIFSGHLEGNTVSFRKKYVPDAVLAGGSDSEIEYRGEKKEGEFAGDFFFTAMPRQFGGSEFFGIPPHFRMEEFKEKGYS